MLHYEKEFYGREGNGWDVLIAFEPEIHRVVAIARTHRRFIDNFLNYGSYK